jgi:hypothetical protein
MVGQDRLVFTEDRTGEELVLPIAQVVKTLDSFSRLLGSGVENSGGTFGFHGGDNDSPVGPYVNFFWFEFPAVKQAVDYFVKASQMSMEEQMSKIKVVAAEPGESAGDFFKRVGIL